MQTTARLAMLRGSLSSLQLSWATRRAATTPAAPAAEPRRRRGASYAPSEDPELRSRINAGIASEEAPPRRAYEDLPAEPVGRRSPAGDDGWGGDGWGSDSSFASEFDDEGSTWGPTRRGGGDRDRGGDRGERYGRGGRGERYSHGGDRFDRGGYREDRGGRGGGERRFDRGGGPRFGRGGGRGAGRGQAWGRGGDRGRGDRPRWGGDSDGEGPGNPRDQLVGECLYGVSPVVAALAAGRREVHRVFVQDGLGGGQGRSQAKDRNLAQRVRRAAEEAGVPVDTVDKHTLNLLANNRPHQGLAADVGPLAPTLLPGAPPREGRSGAPPLWLALDEVSDPQNLGAILRSAHFMGVDGVAVCARNSAPLSAAVSKASAGALEVMDVHEVRNLPRFLTACQEEGWDVLGADAGEGSADVRGCRPRGPCVLVMGSEGFGLRPLVARACTGRVRIDGGNGAGAAGPTWAGEFEVDSLNVSVATGVLLHSLLGGRE